MSYNRSSCTPVIEPCSPTTLYDSDLETVEDPEIVDLTDSPTPSASTELPTFTPYAHLHPGQFLAPPPLTWQERIADLEQKLRDAEAHSEFLFQGCHQLAAVANDKLGYLEGKWQTASETARGLHRRVQYYKGLYHDLKGRQCKKLPKRTEKSFFDSDSDSDSECSVSTFGSNTSTIDRLLD